MITICFVIIDVIHIFLLNSIRWHKPKNPHPIISSNLNRIKQYKSQSLSNSNITIQEMNFSNLIILLIIFSKIKRSPQKNIGIKDNERNRHIRKEGRIQATLNLWLKYHIVYASKTLAIFGGLLFRTILTIEFFTLNNGNFENIKLSHCMFSKKNIFFSILIVDPNFGINSWLFLLLLVK